MVTVSRAVERRARSETRTFGAVTEEVRALVAWLDEQEVPIVAMESTGVYWKPVYRAIRTLNPTRTVWLVNPAHIKAVPGRKTDVKDSAWIAKLLMHGLLAPSFVPEVALLELRDLTRYREKRVGEQASERNRVIKLLEASNVRLASVASDPLGKAGRAIIEALLAGDKTPEQIAETAGRRLRASKRDIARAVEGVLGDATRFLLRQMFAHIDQVDATIELLDARIAELLRPMSDACALVTEIPGINATTVAGVLAEIGTDMSVFPSADHLVSWGGLAPDSHESAGKRKPVATRRGSHWLRVFLVQAAWAATHAKGTFWKRTSSGCARGSDPSRRSSPSPARCSSRSTTCSRTGPRIANSAPTTCLPTSPSAARRNSYISSRHSASTYSSRPPPSRQPERRFQSRKRKRGHRRKKREQST